MQNDYFSLPIDNRSTVILLSSKYGTLPELLEKDIYVCSVLNLLFEYLNDMPIAFKGGTSMVKSSPSVINRFSEDLDIALDYRYFCDIDINNISKSKSERVCSKVNKAFSEFFLNKFANEFKIILNDSFPTENLKIEYDSEGRMRIHYNSLFPDTTNYVKPYVYLEVGTGCSIDYTKQTKILTDLSKYVNDMKLPQCVIPTSDIEKTCWEKMFLVHTACHRKSQRQTYERYSRHWYDLYQLDKHGYIDEALSRFDIFHDVLSTQKVFYRSSYSHFEDCEQGKFLTIPSNALYTILEKDWHSMVDAGMIYGEIPNFKDIMDCVCGLGERIKMAFGGRTIHEICNAGTSNFEAIFKSLSENPLNIENVPTSEQTPEIIKHALASCKNHPGINPQDLLPYVKDEFKQIVENFKGYWRFTLPNGEYIWDDDE